MVNTLNFDQDATQTCLIVNGRLSGIAAKLKDFAAKHGLGLGFTNFKAVYKPAKNFSEITWPTILTNTETTALFLCLGHGTVNNLTITESIDLLDSRTMFRSDGKLWDIVLLVKEIPLPTGVICVERLASLDSIFARNEIRKPHNQQCQVAEKREVISEYLDTGNLQQVLTKPFWIWVEKQPNKYHCSWYREFEAEAQRLREEAEARKKAEEEAKRQQRARTILANNPHQVLRLDPSCPDWLVETYWKALVKTLHSDLNNGSSPEEQRRMTAMLQAVNEAHDKIKKQRGPAWSPKKLPWKEQSDGITKL